MLFLCKRRIKSRFDQRRFLFGSKTKTISGCSGFRKTAFGKALYLWHPAQHRRVRLHFRCKTIIMALISSVILSVVPLLPPKLFPNGVKRILTVNEPADCQVNMRDLSHGSLIFYITCVLKSRLVE